MLRNLEKLISYIDELGLVKGTTFFAGRVLQNNKTITLPNIKYPIYLRPGTSDEKVFVQVFIKNEYNLNLNFTPKVIIDGGANIGLSSVYFKNKFPMAKIIAIEPDSENIVALRSNLKNYDNIFVKQAGLWSKKANTRLIDKYGLGKWGLVVEEIDQQDTLLNSDDSINTCTINDIMEEFNISQIDLLKLDIESAEKQLFTDNYMDWLPKTKVIVIELHDWMTEGCSKPFFTAINQAFSKYRFAQAGENTIVFNNDLYT